jgi:hypothetical protein
MKLSPQMRAAFDIDRRATKFNGAATTAEEIMGKQFQPVKYVVPGIIVEGLTLLAGKPKIGKSWLLLHVAVQIGRGGFTLGEIKCRQGAVLYCALEDNERRLQSRLRKLFGADFDGKIPVTFRTEMPRLAEGGLAMIEDWIKSAHDPQLVIIDTLAMVRSPKKRDETNYDADYGSVQALRAMAAKYRIAIVVVHHLRKQDADDPFDLVSGTLGLTGAPDTVLVMRRDAGKFVLHGHGRDITEIEKALTFNPDACTWTILGDAAATRQSDERGRILRALDEAGEPIGPMDIASAAGMKPANVRALLLKMQRDGTVEKEAYGRYRASVTSSNHTDHTADHTPTNH